MGKNKAITVGLDIGYSNVKLAHAPANGGHVTALNFPARAALASDISNQVMDADIGIEVEVNSEKWIAGLDPAAVPTSGRELDENYITTNIYKALFYAALKEINRPVVAKLVTGLPVSLVQTQAKTLKELFEGEHKIGSTQRVIIEDVTVVPQPLGSFFELTTSGKYQEADLAMSKVLVLDPGWFSFDWVVIDQNRLQGNYSGMSTEAMSRVCEYAAEFISEEHDFPVSPVKIEVALLSKTREIAIKGSRKSIDSALSKAIEKAWETVRREIGQTLRSDSVPPDIVVMSGGGAKHFEDTIRNHFSRSDTYVASDSVNANAMGFHHFAKSKLLSKTSQQKSAANA